MPGATIEVSGVTKTFAAGDEDVLALDDVSLTVESGEFVSLLGPSGCGKSTLMTIVAGLVPQSSGSVTIDGEYLTGPLTDVGIVFQNDLLLPFRTALDNVALQQEIRGKRKDVARREGADLLAHMSLQSAANRYPNELSGGMRQRVSIARAFVHKPSTLLMDEPFGALDAISRVQMQQDLEQLWLDNDRRSVLFITHSVEEAVRMSDRVLVMQPSPGRVAAEIVIDAPRPRALVIEEDAQLMKYTRQIYEIFGKLGIIGSTAA